MHGKTFFLNDASVGWHVCWPHGCREAKSVCFTRQEPTSVLWKTFEKTTSAKHNSIFYGEHNCVCNFQWQCGRKPFHFSLRRCAVFAEPKVFFFSENQRTCDRYRLWNECLWKKQMFLYTYMCLIGATWGCHHVELCEFAHKICAVISDTFLFWCTKWRSHAWASIKQRYQRQWRAYAGTSTTNAIWRRVNTRIPPPPTWCFAKHRPSVTV